MLTLNNSQGAGNFTNLAAGVYDVQATDSKYCYAAGYSVEVHAPTAPNQPAPPVVQVLFIHSFILQLSLPISYQDAIHSRNNFGKLDCSF